MTKYEQRIKELAARLENNSKTTVSGVNTNAKAKVLADLIDTPLPQDKVAVFWFVNKKNIKDAATQIEFWNHHRGNVQSYSAGSNKLAAQLAFPQPGIKIINAEILDKYFPTSEKYQSSCYDLEINQDINHDDFLEFIIRTEYELADTAAEQNYYAKRGGMIEVFPANLDNPIRIEWEGNKIIRLEKFDPKSKGKISDIEQIKLIPAKIPIGSKNLWQLLPKNKNILIVTDDTLPLPKTENRKIIFKTFAKGNIVFDFLPATLYYGNLQLLKADISKMAEQSYQTHLLIKGNKKLLDFFSNLKPDNFKDTDIKTPIGFINALDKEVVLGQNEIFGQEKKISNKNKVDDAFISNLKQGDYVVHLDHGVGKFIGMQKNTVDGGEREYFILEYAEGDRLLVPVEYADKLDRYVGKSNPNVHRLHGAHWHQVKRKIKAKTRAIAGDLLKLYAARQKASGHSYLPDTTEQIELERSFKYEDTPGQRLVTEEIKKDMESAKPMDRLLVGDVGYGKTEISIRAAYKAVQSGKQVAFLCPTTVLAEQHGQTYKKRLEKFPVKVETLSRFKTKAQQQKIVDRLKKGETDIVIGTHRLLSKDIAFKNLGLIILDEEQRFGVKHKEKLKQMRNNIDVLAMSATPIPRTLHFSLSGLRDISTIDTPPPGRQPIETTIEPYSEHKMAKAIREEIKRKGQIYLLHNRVQTINAFAKKLESLMPDVRFGIAHGQLPEKQLSKVMEDFYNRKYDVLICSTIIESGLDIKNVNTIIIDDATKFGLSQLYQLRGRIGRGAVKAFAHFFYKSKKLKGRAKERLEALLEARELGAGFQIAMRDLEIRGSGNLLGQEQHGSINAIGLNLYSRLLHQAVEELETGKIQKPELDVSIDLPLDAYIPDDFSASEETRLRTYKELASVKSEDKLNALVGKIVTKSRSCYSRNDLPKTLQNLITIMELKLIAQSLRILNIDSVNKKSIDGTSRKMIVLSFAEEVDDKLFYEFIKDNTGWERKDEKTIRIDTTRLGEKWLPELKKQLSNKKKADRG